MAALLYSFCMLFHFWNPGTHFRDFLPKMSGASQKVRSQSKLQKKYSGELLLNQVEVSKVLYNTDKESCNSLCPQK